MKKLCMVGLGCIGSIERKARHWPPPVFIFGRKWDAPILWPMNEITISGSPLYHKSDIMKIRNLNTLNSHS